MGTKLLVSNLPDSVDASALEDMFTLVGDVCRVTVESSGVGRVEMSNAEQAQDGIAHFHGQVSGGQILVVREDKPHVSLLRVSRRG